MSTELGLFEFALQKKASHWLAFEIAKRSGSSFEAGYFDQASVFDAAYVVDVGIAFSALRSEYGAEECTLILSRD